VHVFADLLGQLRGLFGRRSEDFVPQAYASTWFWRRFGRRYRRLGVPADFIDDGCLRFNRLRFELVRFEEGGLSLAPFLRAFFAIALSARTVVPISLVSLALRASWPLLLTAVLSVVAAASSAAAAPATAPAASPTSAVSFACVITAFRLPFTLFVPAAASLALPLVAAPTAFTAVASVGLFALATRALFAWPIVAASFVSRRPIFTRTIFTRALGAVRGRRGGPL
jgi:hypothetical protein